MPKSPASQVSACEQPVHLEMFKLNCHAKICLPQSPQTKSRKFQKAKTIWASCMRRTVETIDIQSCHLGSLALPSRHRLKLPSFLFDSEYGVQGLILAADGMRADWAIVQKYCGWLRNPIAPRNETMRNHCWMKFAVGSNHSRAS